MPRKYKIVDENPYILFEDDLFLKRRKHLIKERSKNLQRNVYAHVSTLFREELDEFVPILVPIIYDLESYGSKHDPYIAKAALEVFQKRCIRYY